MCVRLRSRRGEQEMCVPVLNRNGADRQREVCACAGKARPRAAVPAILGD